MNLQANGRPGSQMHTSALIVPPLSVRFKLNVLDVLFRFDAEDLFLCCIVV